MASTDTASRLAPYVEQLMENEYARQNLRAGAEKFRAAYQRSQKRRVKARRDKKLRRQVSAATRSVVEGAKALAGGREKPKRRWPKRLMLPLGAAAVGGGVVLAAGEKRRGSGEPSEQSLDGAGLS